MDLVMKYGVMPPQPMLPTVRPAVTVLDAKIDALAVKLDSLYLLLQATRYDITQLLAQTAPPAKKTPTHFRRKR